MTIFRLPALACMALLSLLALPAQANDPLTWAEGTWEADPEETQGPGEFHLRRDPLIINIDRDNMRYQSSRTGQTWSARILNVSDIAIYLLYDNEDRLDKNGNPIVWSLMFSDPNHFYWVMPDWVSDDKFKRTSKRRRC